VRDDGEFVPTVKRRERGIAVNGRPEPAELSNDEKTVLTNLSMNARMPMPTLARRIGRTVRATEGMVKRLERRLGIKYIAEIDMENLGYLKYMAFVELSGGTPPVEVLRSKFVNEPHVQFLALTSGRYGMVIYFLAKGNEEAGIFIYQTMISKELAPYAAKWYVTPLGKTYNFIPTRDVFFEMLKSRIWQKSRKTPRKGARQITSRGFAVLRALNSGVANFTAIDQENSFDRGAAQYTYYKLKNKDKLLKRITLTMRKLPIRYLAVILIEIVDGKVYPKTRKNLLFNIIKESDGISDRYALEGEFGIPYGVLLIAPIISETGLQDIKEELQKDVEGVRISDLVITNTIIGEMCYRRFDRMYSGQYDLLENFEKAVEKRERTDYDGTGKARKPKVPRGFRGERTAENETNFFE
jgi:DNA-binding Lrp family transcriptional regulator